MFGIYPILSLPPLSGNCFRLKSWELLQYLGLHTFVSKFVVWYRCQRTICNYCVTLSSNFRIKSGAWFFSRAFFPQPFMVSHRSSISIVSFKSTQKFWCCWLMWCVLSSSAHIVWERRSLDITAFGTYARTERCRTSGILVLFDLRIANIAFQTYRHHLRDMEVTLKLTQNRFSFCDPELIFFCICGIIFLTFN